MNAETEHTVVRLRKIARTSLEVLRETLDLLDKIEGRDSRAVGGAS